MVILYMVESQHLMREGHTEEVFMRKQTHHTPLGFSLSGASRAVIYWLYDVKHTTTEAPVADEASNTDFAYYDDAEVAKLLGVWVARLRNKISAGEPLPPRLRAKGRRK